MNRIKELLLVLISGLILFTGCKTTDKGLTPSLEKKITEEEALADALLWKINGKNLQNPSYLFGTIHLIDAEDYFLPQGTLAAIENSDKLVFEIDMNEMSDMNNLMGIMMQAFMKDNITLKDLLSDEDYEVVNKHFQELGLPLMMLERIKPMFLSALAYGDMDPTGLQSGSMKSYEFELYEMAENSEKEVGGLETIEFQMGIFDSIPYKEQANMLVETIKKSDTESDEFDKMIEMYTNQKITAMIQMIGDETEQLSEHEDILVTMRNKNWIPIMSELMLKQPTFFAVGAGHLAGPNGVIRLLQKDGYTVSPISNKKIMKL